MSYEGEKAAALKAASCAARLCEQVRLELATAVVEKRDGTPVTVADFGAQAVICRIISDAFPDDSVVAEEDGDPLREPSMKSILEGVEKYVQEYMSDATPQSVVDWINRGNGEVGTRFWAIDPIDGTKGFVRGDQYAVAIALIEAGQVKLGVLACPSLSVAPGNSRGRRGVLFVAVRGQGASMHRMEGHSLSSIHTECIGQNASLPFVESVESTHCDHHKQMAVARAVGIHVPSLKVDGQAKYGIVARGEALLYLRFPHPQTPPYLEKIWDHAAGSIIVEEAGGRVTDMEGLPFDFSCGPEMKRNRGIIAGQMAFHERALKVLKSGEY
jgi:3'(2'), 5'-bisphosphate nucleotidase